MQFAKLLFIGAASAVKLRTTHKVKQDGPGSMPSPDAIMEMFDTDGNGTIWKKEYEAALGQMCGDNEECFEKGMEHFRNARGDTFDGVQIEEV